MEFSEVFCTFWTRLPNSQPPQCQTHSARGARSWASSPPPAPLHAYPLWTDEWWRATPPLPHHLHPRYPRRHRCTHPARSLSRPRHHPTKSRSPNRRHFSPAAESCTHRRPHPLHCAASSCFLEIDVFLFIITIALIPKRFATQNWHWKCEKIFHSSIIYHSSIHHAFKLNVFTYVLFIHHLVLKDC